MADTPPVVLPFGPISPEEVALLEKARSDRAKLSDKQFSAVLDIKTAPPVTPESPGLKQIGSALLRTIYESADSKKATTGIISAIAAVLSLVAGKQGWTWLDPQTSQLIAGVIVAQALGVIASHTVVDKAKAQAQGPQAPLSQAPDAPRAPAEGK